MTGWPPTGVRGTSFVTRQSKGGWSNRNAQCRRAHCFSTECTLLLKRRQVASSAHVHAFVAWRGCKNSWLRANPIHLLRRESYGDHIYIVPPMFAGSVRSHGSLHSGAKLRHTQSVHPCTNTLWLNSSALCQRGQASPHAMRATAANANATWDRIRHTYEVALDKGAAKKAETSVSCQTRDGIKFQLRQAKSLRDKAKAVAIGTSRCDKPCTAVLATTRTDHGVLCNTVCLSQPGLPRYMC